MACALSDVDYMYLALAEAEKAFSRESVPVGAVIVCNNEVIASSGNEVEKNKLVTCHAEMVAIQRASEKLNQKFLTECSIYVTLEPCAMCAQAISLARFKSLYFGAYDQKYGAVVNGCHVFQYALHKPTITGGILEQECAAILRRFFVRLRSK